MIIFSGSTSQWPPQEAKVLLQWHCVICSVSLSPAFQAPGCYFTASMAAAPQEQNCNLEEVPTGLKPSLVVVDFDEG